MREKERIKKEDRDDTDRWDREITAKSKRETEINGLPLKAGFYQLFNSVSRLLQGLDFHPVHVFL